MMSGELYRFLIVTVLVLGLIPGVAYLWLYGRPIKRWWAKTSRDASGWVAIICLLYGWSLFRTTLTWIRNLEVAVQPFWSAIIAIGIGLALDWAMFQRLRTYLKLVRYEKMHPTMVCPVCEGSGVIPAKG